MQCLPQPTFLAPHEVYIDHPVHTLEKHSPHREEDDSGLLLLTPVQSLGDVFSPSGQMWLSMLRSYS